MEAFLRESWWYIQGLVSERGKHLKPKVSGMTVAKTWAGLFPNPMLLAFMFDQKNKHSVDISLENRFHNETTFHQSWVHLNVAIEYTLDKWKSIFSTWEKKRGGGLNGCSIFLKVGLYLQKRLTVKSFRNWNLSKTKKWVLNDSWATDWRGMIKYQAGKIRKRGIKSERLYVTSSLNIVKFWLNYKWKWYCIHFEFLSILFDF